jgi:hypothetical protein
VTVNWDTNRSPSGTVASTTMPYFLYAYDSQGDILRWAAHTFSTVANMPRAAFSDGSVAPDYFLVGYSQETSGSRRYVHRTGFKNNITGWDASFTGSLMNRITSSVQLKDGGGVGFNSPNATDGSLLTQYEFVGTSNTVFYVDLLSVQSFSDILIHNLGVGAFRNARVSVDLSTNTASDPTSISTWTTKVTYDGDQDFKNWVYIGHSEAGMSARWIRVQVTNYGGGSAPYLDFVGEVRVLY